MKAAQFVGKSLFEINEVKDPICSAGGLLVCVHACAICGTDWKIMQCQDVKIEKGKVTSIEVPRITGHEFSGVVVEAGKAAINKGTGNNSKRGKRFVPRK